MLSFLVTLFCLLFAVQASPLSFVPRAALDVFVPQIISPNSNTVWSIGQIECVEWVTTDAPEHISNGAAVMLNGYSTPLAKDFDLRVGQVNFTVPTDVVPGYHYITLFGDSGDRSELFLII
ncbi:hypothetical protein BYT27DRAFT_7188096 [Phlegmacium glaucopus]|nr:hypothetical protein BYT27DRAFT_7188096 [Phlegmacium glaucopus]